MSQFSKIVFAVDSDNLDTAIVEKTLDVAKHLQSHVTIIDVLPNFSWLTKSVLPNHQHVNELIEKEKKDALDGLAEQFRQDGLTVETELLRGRTSQSIIQFVKENESDLVIRVNKGRKSKQPGLLGQTAIQLIRRSPCSVWLMHSETQPASEQIVACVDAGSDDPDELQLADSIMRIAQDLSDHGQGKLSILHAWQLWNSEMVRARISQNDFELWKESARHLVESQFDKFLGRHSKSIDDKDVFLKEGEVASVISSFVSNLKADLVILGNVGRSGFSGLFHGNAVERIFEKVTCDVLAVKSGSPLNP